LFGDKNEPCVFRASARSGAFFVPETQTPVSPNNPKGRGCLKNVRIAKRQKNNIFEHYSTVVSILFRRKISKFRFFF